LAFEITQSLGARLRLGERQQRDLFDRLDRREHPQLRQAPDPETAVGREDEIQREEQDVHGLVQATAAHPASRHGSDRSTWKWSAPRDECLAYSARSRIRSTNEITSRTLRTCRSASSFSGVPEAP